MLLNVTESLSLPAAPAEVWQLLRATERMAALVPGVDSAVRIEPTEPEAYRVQVTEKVGPFKVTMKLEVNISEIVETKVLGAMVKGGDSIGLGRATGSVRIELTPSEVGTSMYLTVNVEILGKLSTLGSPVIRRRVTELFGEFGRRLVAQFQAA
jgi:uncharacterized protein